MRLFFFRALVPAITMGFLFASCSDDPTTPSTELVGLGEPCAKDEDCLSGINIVCMDTGDGECGPIVKRCVALAPSCGESPMRTACGCDGKTLAIGPCGPAKPANVDLRAGACPAAAGTFWCGAAACNAGPQYCVEGYTSIDCFDLPVACAPPNGNCSCLMAQNMTGCGCVDEPGGGIRVNGCGI